jgi:hypothetical protein
VVEPYASDEATGNMNPAGRVYYNFSTLLCVPNALSQPGGFALGAQAGEAATAETPFHLVYEVRPLGSR